MPTIKYKKPPHSWRSGTYEWTNVYEDGTEYHTYGYPCVVDKPNKGNGLCCHAECRSKVIADTKGEALAARLKMNRKLLFELRDNWWRFTRNENPRGSERRRILALYVRSVRQRGEFTGADYTAAIWIDVAVPAA